MGFVFCVGFQCDSDVQLQRGGKSGVGQENGAISRPPDARGKYSRATANDADDVVVKRELREMTTQIPNTSLVSTRNFLASP